MGHRPPVLLQALPVSWSSMIFCKYNTKIRLYNTNSLILVLATSPVNIAHSEVCNACKVLFVKAANAHHNLI